MGKEGMGVLWVEEASDNRIMAIVRGGGEKGGTMTAHTSHSSRCSFYPTPPLIKSSVKRDAETRTGLSTIFRRFLVVVG